MAHTENSGQKEFPPIASQLIPPLILSRLRISSKVIRQCSMLWQKFCRRPLLLWVPNCMNIPNVKWSRSISWQRQFCRWLLCIMPISWLQSTPHPENSDNSNSGEDDEENDRWNRVSIHEMDRSLYNETNLAASFLSHQETSSSSVATTEKPEDYPR